MVLYINYWNSLKEITLSIFQELIVSSYLLLTLKWGHSFTKTLLVSTSTLGPSFYLQSSVLVDYL